MKRILTAVVLIPLVLLAVFRAPLWLFALLVLLIAILATLEYLHIAERTGLLPFRRLTLLMITTLFVFTGAKLTVEDQLRQLQQNQPSAELPAKQYSYLEQAWKMSSVGVSLVLAIPFFLLVRGMRRQDLSTSLPGTAASSFALIYPGLPLLTLMMIRARPFGSLLLFYLLLVVWAGDVFAYYVGSTIGHHKLAPRISPGKSWEGAAASLLAASLLGALMVDQARPIKEFLESTHLTNPGVGSLGFSLPLYGPPWWHGLLLSMAINIAAQLGDLVESMLKRGAGLKDSGTLLPGHGGMLDRIDALLFAAPVLWCYATFHLIPF